jgi:hypothetical protein
VAEPTTTDKTKLLADLLAGNGTPGRVELRAQRVSRKAKVKKPRGITMTLSELREFVFGLVPEQAVFDPLWAVVSAIFLELDAARFKTTEKFRRKQNQTEDLASESLPEAAAEGRPACGDAEEKPPKKNPKHKGRQTAENYPNAEQFSAPTDGELAVGEKSPCGCGGRLREEDSTFALSFRGVCPIQAESHECKHYRCNKCQQRYSTKPLKKGASRRHQSSAISAVALSKYACGLPFNRMRSMLGFYGISLAATTLFEMSLKGARAVLPLFVELVEQGAQAKKIGTDDTRAIILEGHRPEQFEKRDGTRTTGLQCETDEGHKIAIFMTGVKHAGENLTDLLKLRRPELGEPIHMSDGISHNAPKKGSPSVISADCLIHARRYFVKLVDIFPVHCQYVLELFGRVYANDAYSKRQEMTPAERLTFHQLESKPVLEELRRRMEGDLKDNLVEQNSPLGKAYRYMLKRWQGLTVFLRVEGAELDNNAIERQLKKAILNRKNAYFYRSNRGALVGDIYMSLIYTCELNGGNPFDYLNQLQEHASDLAANPSNWMPWTYLETLKRMALSDSPTEALPRAA